MWLPIIPDNLVGDDNDNIDDNSDNNEAVDQKQNRTEEESGILRIFDPIRNFFTGEEESDKKTLEQTLKHL